MKNNSTKFYHIGLSVASNSSHSSAACIINNSREIVLLDKLYFTDDIKLFFEKSTYLQNASLMIGLIKDETLLDGKWRIHSKNYKMISNMFQINKNNWTKRLDNRLCDLFSELNKTHPVFRCNAKLLRQSYGLNPDYLENTSLDCKTFQAALKIKYGFNMPDNLLPASALEAVLFALFSYDIANQNLKYKELSEFNGIKVVNPI